MRMRNSLTVIFVFHICMFVSAYVCMHVTVFVCRDWVCEEWRTRPWYFWLLGLSRILVLCWPGLPRGTLVPTKRWVCNFVYVNPSSYVYKWKFWSSIISFIACLHAFSDLLSALYLLILSVVPEEGWPLRAVCYNGYLEMRVFDRPLGSPYSSCTGNTSQYNRFRCI